MAAAKKKWSNAITRASKYHTPPGLFAEADARTIAQVLRRDSSSYKQAMARLTFYMNRAGKNLPAAAKRRCEHAKQILHAMHAREAMEFVKGRQRS